MQSSSTKHLKLAQQMLVYEAIRSQLNDNLAATMNIVCQRLYQRLTPLIGSAGFYALLGRGLSLAKNNYAWLDLVKIAEQDDCSLQGLNESMQEHCENGASSGLATILSNVIWLLVSFIGEDIVITLIKETWPEVSIGDQITMPDKEKSYE